MFQKETFKYILQNNVVAPISELLIILNKNTRLQPIFPLANDFKLLTRRIGDILYLLLIDIINSKKLRYFVES